MSDPVAAITEAAAAGETAAIFADIRQVLGVEVVNLIWRHLATMPGALPWAWGTVRPLYADGTIKAEAASLHEELALPQIPDLPPEALTASGLMEPDLVSIRHILTAYDHTNAMALVALSALLSALDEAVVAPDEGRRPATAALADPQAPIPLPVLPNLTDLPTATGDLVRTLNRLGTRREDPVLASMYRHLAYWPAYLALCWAIIAPLDQDGRLALMIADAIAKARARAVGIMGRLHYSAPDPAAVAALRAALEPFTADVIARMVVICAILRKVTAPA